MAWARRRTRAGREALSKPVLCWACLVIAASYGLRPIRRFAATPFARKILAVQVTLNCTFRPTPSRHTAGYHPQLPSY